MASAGMDLEKPRPLQVSVGVWTSVSTGFLSMADITYKHTQKGNSNFKLAFTEISSFFWHLIGAADSSKKYDTDILANSC